MSVINDLASTGAFLLIIGGYVQDVPSMRRIMDCMDYYETNGTEDADGPTIGNPNLFLHEYTMAHGVIVATQSNPLLKEMIASFLTARGRSDTNVKTACRWFSSVFHPKVLNVEDAEAYSRERVRWESKDGPKFVDEDADANINNEKEESELRSGVSDDQEPIQAQTSPPNDSTTHNDLSQVQSNQEPAIPPRSLDGSPQAARQWNLVDYTPSPPTFPNVNKRRKCSKQCTKSRRGQLTIRDFRLKVAGTRQLYSECSACLDRTWNKKGGWKPAAYR